ncbi:MAG: hypothetical protein INR73_21240 [Williamsia sp.]|nr:hypothetical protein [Williamsia sp.]
MGGGSSSGKADSLAHRTGLEDSLTITYRYLDTTRYSHFDSSYADFSRRYPVPAQYAYLGNVGNAARSLLFNPITKAGWDPGFHAYDIYQFNVPETKFYNTTRPYTELGYVIGSNTEQMIHVLHTQNVTPDWNVALQYRLINSLGLFKNQNTNHSSYRINSSYQSKDRRYHLYFVMLRNKLQSGENGGIRSYADLDSKIYKTNRAGIPVWLGNERDENTNLFNSTFTAGTRYKTFNFSLRQQYDLGKKDSLVKDDTTVIRLFYPKLRIEHSLQVASYGYRFTDQSGTPDTLFYRKFYDFLQNPARVDIQDKWNEVTNDVSFYQFPDTKNPQQFIKVGGTFQYLQGTFDAGKQNYYNLFVHGEYRNKTRNQKWEIEATGELYGAGYNAGNYEALISLKRLISKKIGYLQAGFQNSNRTPSFVYNTASSFSFYAMPSFNNENITRLFASLEQPLLNLRLTGSYYAITNYTYFSDYYHASQSSPLFNLLQIGAEKVFAFSKHFKLYSQVTVQQKAGSAPVNVPLVYTRNRIGYEGNLGFKSLSIYFGLEGKYHTPYKADGYSPLLGQFFYQDTATIRLKAPELNAYMHFRIRSFTAYIRGENLNTYTLRNGFGDTNNNLAAPLYPYPGFRLHVGIFWSFVN